MRPLILTAETERRLTGWFGGECSGRDATTLDGVALWSIAASTGIFFTTIHSQDFKDVDGDRAIGRQTIPIVFGALARFTVIIPLLLWSVGLSVVWGLDVATCATFVLLGIFVGAQYVVGKTVHEYQVAFYWYNVSPPNSLHPWLRKLMGSFGAAALVVRRTFVASVLSHVLRMTLTPSDAPCLGTCYPVLLVPVSRRVTSYCRVHTCTYSRPFLLGSRIDRPDVYFWFTYWLAGCYANRTHTVLSQRERFRQLDLFPPYNLRRAVCLLSVCLIAVSSPCGCSIATFLSVGPCYVIAQVRHVQVKSTSAYAPTNITTELRRAVRNIDGPCLQEKQMILCGQAQGRAQEPQYW